MLRFGTAGLRGPLHDGPDGMNVTTVTRTTAGIVDWLRGRCLGGGAVVVGRDARHGSAEFATATAEVFAAAGFPVTLLPRPLPTPVVAYAVRELGAVAGVQVTASHNPATDNGYKVYLDGGSQLIAPADTEIERCIEKVIEPVDRATVTLANDDMVRRYLRRVTELPALIGGPGERARIRIALTPLHGVGGDLAVEALTAAGFPDVHMVDEQFEPDPDFPTVAFPNPEEPGATDLLHALAARISADVAIALDPDADRCMVGIPQSDGTWQMLRGDETGVLLGDCVLRTAAADALVATTIVSSRLLSRLAPARGGRYAETLTGFKWLARAGDGLVYAYEEAIGHCVDPATVRDKDGISAAVLVADLVARLKAVGRTLNDELDDYAVEFGLHAGDQVSLRLASAADAAAVVERLRANPPDEIADEPVEYTDQLQVRGRMRTDALIFEGASSRLVVRPSGTEPKLKCYLEVVETVGSRADLPGARNAARVRLSALRDFCLTL
ncbi:phospho-sugar mutase [Nocardia sp. NBC_00508]|uniref:phospho-sugar mutase n=1 Tax=Nocardia sp. NBC_00508 TaxID=2975992 RepID=UPI002E80E088|nr:phospho-sugar mutase [Nocardia sp. NBC_00508]WUD68478.1 phospho-sugar mutase [Nocardia sp. NBC_00508]